MTDYTYSSNNYLTSETQVVGSNDLTTTYVNNAYGQPTQETDPAGNTTYYTYDQYGDPQTRDRLARRHDLVQLLLTIPTPRSTSPTR